jgi:hypothetical protein
VTHAPEAHALTLCRLQTRIINILEDFEDFEDFGDFGDIHVSVPRQKTDVCDCSKLLHTIARSCSKFAESTDATFS